MVGIEVLLAILLRMKEGKRKYGTFLKTFNGRDARIDLFQELIDALFYQTQLLMEEDKKREKRKKRHGKGA